MGSDSGLFKFFGFLLRICSSFYCCTLWFWIIWELLREFIELSTDILSKLESFKLIIYYI